MTINEARKILGKDGNGLSDAEIQRDIDAAELYKNLFFTMFRKLKKHPKNPSNQFPNMP